MPHSHPLFVGNNTTWFSWKRVSFKRVTDHTKTGIYTVVRRIHLNTLVSSLTYGDYYHVFDCAKKRICRVETTARDEVVGVAVVKTIIWGLIRGSDTVR